jgi:hypothetical protein
LPYKQLLIYRFGLDSRFEGQLVGALERLESGGTMRVLDALFVAREPQSGELTAISVTGGTGGVIGELLGFRLDASARRAATRKARRGHAAEAVEALGEALPPGHAVAAVLVQHAWADALQDAVSRVGGVEAGSEFVDASRLSEVTSRLLAAADAPGEAPLDARG